MGLADIADRHYGPSFLAVTGDRVSSYVGATGDDPVRWSACAPPGFASAALFAVAPELLTELAGTSVVHGEQTFIWHRSLDVGLELTVEGTVSRVRERGGLNYVGFDLIARAGTEDVITGSSLFLVSGEMPPVEPGSEHAEPNHADRGDPDPGQRAASRADLVRYAAATHDWNPIHWDHEAAVDAGLPGVVVHGLLQAAWAMQAASELSPGPAPLISCRARFRNPLFPAHPVSIITSPSDSSVIVSVHDGDREYVSARVELGHE
jgi:acyl dehydratase